MSDKKKRSNCSNGWGYIMYWPTHEKREREGNKKADKKMADGRPKKCSQVLLYKHLRVFLSYFFFIFIWLLWYLYGCVCLLDVHVCLLYIIQFFGCCCPRSLSLYYPFSLFSSSSFFLLLPSPFKPSPIYTRHCTYPFISSGLPFPYIYIYIPRYIYSGLNKRKKKNAEKSLVCW